MSMNLIQVIEQIGREKGIEREVLIDAVGAAILSASRKTLGPALDLRVDFDAGSGRFRLYAIKRVVDVVTNPKAEVSLAEALAQDPQAKGGAEIRVDVEAGGFGRIAAQTAKQVIIQRVREAERDSVYQAFKEKEGELVNGVVQRVVKGNVILSLGKAEAILPQREQLSREEYRVGDRIRAYVLDVKKTAKGSQIIISRTHPGFLVHLFRMEVPEIAEGIVEIKAVAREPGDRAKIAVVSKDPNVDQVGACVGYRGARVQAIVRELGGEKIDIIPWREDPAAFVRSALQPADVEGVTVNAESHTLTVTVADEQLSLAIGKRGVNARLAAKLVGWKVDIKSHSELARAAAALEAPPAGQAPSAEAAGAPAAAPEAADALAALTSLPGVGEKTAARLLEAGYASPEAVAAASAEELQKVEGIGVKIAEKILAAAQGQVRAG